MIDDIELLAEGTGPHVRTVAVTEPQAVDSSGNAQADVTRHQQVISAVDRYGDFPTDLAPQILLELRRIGDLLNQINLKLD